MSAIESSSTPIVKPEANVMIDFETLGLKPNSVILSVGLCLVPPYTAVFPEIYKEFNLTAQTRFPYNRKIDDSTAAWWSIQPNCPDQGTEDLYQGMMEIHRHLHELSNTHEVTLWANGSDFDIPILYNVFEGVGKVSPVPYNSVRDFRTLRKTFPEVKAPEFVGQKHHALDDAINQAAHLSLILAHIQKLRQPHVMAHIT